ncbi:hypothetical protein Peur_006498 [Populus x canadensis]
MPVMHRFNHQILFFQLWLSFLCLQMAARANENYNSKTFSNQGRESLMKSINGLPILHSYIHLANFCWRDSSN